MAWQLKHTDISMKSICWNPPCWREFGSNFLHKLSNFIFLHSYQLFYHHRKGVTPRNREITVNSSGWHGFQTFESFFRQTHHNWIGLVEKKTKSLTVDVIFLMPRCLLLLRDRVDPQLFGSNVRTRLPAGPIGASEPLDSNYWSNFDRQCLQSCCLRAIAFNLRSGLCRLFEPASSFNGNHHFLQ